MQRRGADKTEEMLTMGQRVDVGQEAHKELSGFTKKVKQGRKTTKVEDKWEGKSWSSTESRTVDQKLAPDKRSICGYSSPLQQNKVL